MQIMHDSTPTPIKDIFPAPPGAGAATVPAPHRGQGMCHGYALTPLGSPRRRALAVPQLLQQGFIGMQAETAARGAGGTTIPPRTAGPWGGGALDDLSWCKGQALAPPDTAVRSAPHRAGRPWWENTAPAARATPCSQWSTSRSVVAPAAWPERPGP